jgi:sigma-B regulation protein RsbU (phosphoserine phosphatase)
VALAINALVITAFTGIAYWQERDSFLRGVDEKLHLAANSMPHLLPKGYLAAIGGPGSQTPADYQQTQQVLSDYAKANGLAFIYLCVGQAGQFYFVASSTNERELATGTAAVYYERYEDAPPEIFAAWRTGTPRLAEYEDAYGQFRSMFLPLRTGAGDKRFVVGVDVSVDFIRQELRNTILLCVGIGVAIFLITVAVSEPLLSHLLAPIGRLTRSTRELVAGKFQLSETHRAALASMATAQQDEIGQLAHAFDEMIKQLEIYIEDLKVVTAAKERIESEMKIAGDIQQGFVPHAYQPQPGQVAVDLHAVLNPAKQVGGDLYDFFHLSEDHLFFAIGDVSDKGAPAALFMAVTLTLLRTLVKHDATPDHLLAATNRALSERNEAYQFVTLFCGVLNTRTGAVQYAHGGHNPPYVFAPARGELRALTPVSGMALGAFASAEYQTDTLQLAADEILLLYTDGVTEAMNAAHELYGEARLEACLQTIGATTTAEQVTSAVLADVAAHTQDAPPSDDLTMLCIRLES